jgi:hypothetical protein
MRRILIAAFWLAGLGVASPAAAQTAGSGKWEIEFHSGGTSPTHPTDGSVSLPGPGQVFTTSAIYPPPAAPVLVVASSRRESSWYFGDGALLFNQAALALAPSAMTAPFSGRIATLDPVLSRPLGEWRSGGSIGARVSRVLTPRLGAEWSVDYGLVSVQMTQANVDAIEATRASFIEAFGGFITSNPGRTLKSLTSTAALEGGGHHLFTSAALIINLKTTGKVIPYATVGASLISTVGKMPSATLEGNYQFSNASGSMMNETDRVTVRDAGKDGTVAGILGSGVKYQVSPRWGVRVDTRIFLSKNAARTALDATPLVALGQLPAGRLVLNADPTITFSNNWSDPVTALKVTAVAASTLSGPAMSGVRTFAGTGVSSYTSITAGVFWRF